MASIIGEQQLYAYKELTKSLPLFYQDKELSLRGRLFSFINGGGKGTPTFDIEAAVAVFYGHLEIIHEFLPQGTDLNGWKAFKKIGGKVISQSL